MTTPAKLYGKDLSEYDEIDVDELLQKLSPEEINILAKEVDPDVSLAILGYVSSVDCLVSGYVFTSFAKMQLRLRKGAHGTPQQKTTHRTH